MEMKKIQFAIDDGILLKNNEKNLSYIPPFDYGNRSTDIDYISIEADNLKRTIPVVRYKIYEKYDRLLQGFSTRFGGVSRGHLSTMNLSFSRGDEEENVYTNHRLLAKAMGYDYRRLVFSDQVHKTDIHIATEADIGKGIVRKSDLTGIDGFVTNITELPLITFFADCVPIYAYDPVKHVLGLAHSGWRGTVEGIGTKLIYKMGSAYGCAPEDIVCAIGPSICQSCYEVDEDVISRFDKKYKNDFDIEKIYYPKGNNKYQLNLHMACKFNFICAGVEKENIAMPDLCTCCNSEVFFSHRATNGQRGNLAAIAMLRK